MGDRKREGRKGAHEWVSGLSINLEREKKEKVVRKEINVWIFWNLTAFL